MIKKKPFKLRFIETEFSGWARNGLGFSLSRLLELKHSARKKEYKQ